MARKHYTIPWNGTELSAAVDTSGTPKTPLVIISHGFIGSKTGVDRLFVKAAEGLTKHGMGVLRFDYMGCGESPGNYGDTTFEEMISQTRAVIDHAFSLEWVDADNVILLGHSLGGAAAVHALEGDPRISRLIMWSAAAKPYEDITRLLEEGARKGSSIEYHGYTFTERYIASLSGYDPLALLGVFKGKALFVHGSRDEDIPFSYSLQFNEACLNGRVHIVDGASHTYSNASHFDELQAVTLDWLIQSGKKPE
ncbi:alpha/beta hydrolase [Peribacillus sp. SCS-37]|uniref:alpha/beta hydrolase n=1 Tax=Paraperibacillus esterisolvens TaxID=3115296 RepID=UPI003906B9E1